MVEGRLHLHICTQSPVMNQEALANILACDEDDIRIVPTAVGGGFGSKLDLIPKGAVSDSFVLSGIPLASLI